jgi:hypothetical protein
MVIAGCMISCRQRSTVRLDTLAAWASSDWTDPLAVEIDDDRGSADVVGRISATWQRALQRAADAPEELWLFVEDDVEPARAIRHALATWMPLTCLTGSAPLFASLYRCNQPLLYRNEGARYAVAAPEAAWGSQALLLSRATIRYLVLRWDEVDVRHHDLRIAQLAARISPIYVHLPSLVQHRDVGSTWGNGPHRAFDFDPDWRTP